MPRLGHGFIVLLVHGFIVLLGHGFIVLLGHGFIVLLGHGFIVLLTLFSLRLASGHVQTCLEGAGMPSWKS